MPFHSTETEQEAQELVVRYCKLSYNDEYIVPYWKIKDRGIVEAMEAAAEHFQLNPETMFAK